MTFDTLARERALGRRWLLPAVLATGTGLTLAGPVWAQTTDLGSGVDEMPALEPGPGKTSAPAQDEGEDGTPSRGEGDDGARGQDAPDREGAPRQDGAEQEGRQAPNEVPPGAEALLEVDKHLYSGKRISVSGKLASRQDDRTALVQIRRGGSWRTVARARSREDGRFSAAWRPERAGSMRIRVRAESAPASERRTDVDRIKVYRRSVASWYGPGFYGQRTACGRTIRRGTLGVAHKSLPCGRKVSFRYGGKSVTVPVIDRGPFVGGREWDLTAATKHRLGFPSTGRIWTTG